MKTDRSPKLTNRNVDSNSECTISVVLNSEDNMTNNTSSMHNPNRNSNRKL